MTRFAYAFAGVAVVAAVSGGMGALIVGQSTPTAPTAPTVGAVQSEWTPAVITPAVTPVAGRTITRTIVVRESNPTQETQMAGAPADARSEVKAGNAHTVTTPDPTPTPMPAAPAVAAQPDPTPSPTLPPSTGEPSSMHGQPDPQLGGVTPGDPSQTPPPLDQ